MCYYEIVFMVYFDQSEQVLGMIECYIVVIIGVEGKIYCLEDWGCCQLVYLINKLYKVYYVLMNVEVLQEVIDELEIIFCFNDVVICSMVMCIKYVVIEVFLMVKVKDECCECCDDFVNEIVDDVDVGDFEE